ncbi:LysR family transcriptional regulator [Rhizobium sp. L1K21]|uniref:LysR family transcriptional regulator n=1 Tax=Rhizobium sp. L1K21 TaxID=2954933 RepID=UPI002092AAB8|nr:LysR family transcriptional regulator [Rhizobium sp. L1K21]MCO6185353.1 LysR family transcriptional regulator [Rhizobium sp. L1K21]
MPISHLTLRQLQAIRAVYETGRISAAAERLNVSQSAASVLLSQAEAALGNRLFDRTTRHIAPTEAAELTIGTITRILDDVQALGVLTDDLRNLDRGRIRIAATPATGIALLPTTVRRFKTKYPNVELSMNDCAPDQFFSIIRDEKVDFGLGIASVDRGEFDVQVVHSDPLCLLCNVDHRLAKQSTVSWADLKGEPMIISRRDYGVRAVVEHHLRNAGAGLEIANEIGFLYSAEWMVTCDMGVSVFPSRLAEEIRSRDVCKVPIVEPVATRDIGIVTKKGRSLPEAAAKFAEMLVEDLR